MPELTQSRQKNLVNTVIADSRDPVSCPSELNRCESK